MNVFSPLKKSVKKVVRRPHYLWDFMHIPVSSSFAILPHRTPPLAAQDAHDAKHMVCSIQDGPYPSKNNTGAPLLLPRDPPL